MSHIDTVKCYNIIVWLIVLLGLTAAVVSMQGVGGQLFNQEYSAVFTWYGILLGIGQAGLGTMLCYVVIQLSLLFSKPDIREEAVKHSKLAKRSASSFMILSNIPLPISLLYLLLLSCTEEILLRATIVYSGTKLDLISIIIVVTIVFLIVQIFPWSTPMNTVFSVIGTLVTAPINAFLLTFVADIRPFISIAVYSSHLLGTYQTKGGCKMKFGLSFLPDTTASTKSAVDYYRDAIALSKQADEAGMHFIKMTEHYLHLYGGYCPSPITFLAAVASVTSLI
ncbi:hypothetical protein M5W68_10080 [Paenibacillus larvae]|nr:hypothetical protein [Paenibacillus larvae]MCY9525460.1 hypothetical protein [Paenibacillus larvae]